MAGDPGRGAGEVNPAQVRAAADEWAPRVADRDTRAFDAMFREFAAPLRRFAFRCVRSRDVADELVQDVFLGVWRAPPALAQRAEVRAYLYRAVRNRALDHLEREGVRRRWRDERARAIASGEPRPVAASADEEFEGTELMAAIDAALGEMPNRRRQVCELRWRQGLSVVEVAARLGISPKTAEIQIGRGLKQLRERLGSR